MTRLTYLDAKEVGVGQGTPVRVSEVLRDSHLPPLSKREGKVVGTSATQLLDDSCPILINKPRFRIPGPDSDSCQEPLELDSLAIGEAPSGGQRVGVLSPNELLAQFEKRPSLIHDAGGDVDVDEHATKRWTNRLEISTPKHKSAADILGFSVGKEGTNVECVIFIERWLHSNYDVLHRWR